MRCAYKSRVGFVNNRNKKHNQDAFIIHPYLKKVKGQYLFAVCDGHGVHGHDVSGFIKEFLVSNIEDSIPDIISDIDNLIAALRTGVLKTNLQLNEGGINLDFSGSTLNAILIRSSLLLCANVGDSRSVVAKQRGDSWHAISLSRDHKPDLPSEAARILSNNGRVESYFDQNGVPVGPARVWLANKQIPGLAMSRSLGDAVASSVGVIADPEIQVYELTKEDKFIIIASDGIWEFISSEEAVAMVSTVWHSGNAESCCDKLVKEATIRWQKEEENIDDMTVIVIFLNVHRF
jgi:serine/threonine protein phosphatase PrpC